MKLSARNQQARVRGGSPVVIGRALPFAIGHPDGSLLAPLRTLGGASADGRQGAPGAGPRRLTAGRVIASRGRPLVSSPKNATTTTATSATAPTRV